MADENMVDTFVLGLNLGPEAIDFLQSLPEEVCAKVVSNFDPSRSKDGNVWGRLQAFANSMLEPRGATSHATAALARKAASRADDPFPPASVASSKDVAVYCEQIGLDEFGTQLLQAMPLPVQRVVIEKFDPSGTKDGKVGGRLLGFVRGVWAQTLGLNGLEVKEAADILRAHTEEAQLRVMSQFDATGTKDGNVLARLQIFVNSVAGRLGVGQKAVAPKPRQENSGWGGGFVGGVSGAGYGGTTVARGGCRGGGYDHFNGTAPVADVTARMADFIRLYRIDSEGSMFLHSLHEDVQHVVVTSFSPRGTKDGNLWGRLFGFVRSVWIQRLGLDNAAVDFIKSLPEDAQRIVMVKFDPSRTKDGNVLARLESFARSVAGSPAKQDTGGKSWEATAGWSASGKGPRKDGGSKGSWSALSPRYDSAPAANPAAPAKLLPLRPAPRGQPSRPPALIKTVEPKRTLEGFVKRWGLNAEAEAFVKALPTHVSSVVISDFNANGTKDGNIWKRLFGFIRAVWISKARLNKEALEYFKEQPEEVQSATMSLADFSTFSQPATLEELQIVVLEAAAAPDQYANAAAYAPEASASTGHVQSRSMAALDPFASFARRCHLEREVVSNVLSSLAPEVQEAVINDFDPGGTKDGNVVGRLEGFARSVEKRITRKRVDSAGQWGDQAAGKGGKRLVRPRLF